MSGQHHHHDPIEDNIDTHPVKLAIGVAVGAVALVIGIILMAQLAVGMYGSRSMKDDASMAKFALTINGFGNVRTETCRAFEEQEFRTLVGQLP